MQMIVKAQTQKIHIAVKQLGIEREDYEKMLFDGYRKTSSKFLTYEEAEDLLDTLMKAGFKPTQTNPPKGKKENQWGKSNHEELRGRRISDAGPYAAPQQLRLIEARWQEVSGNTPEKGLNKFIKRIAKVDHINWLLEEDVKKVIKALDSWDVYKKKKAMRKK